MNNFSKIVIAILIFISLMWVRETFFPQLTFNDIVKNMGIKEKISSITPDVFDDELELNSTGEKIIGEKKAQEKYENMTRIYFLKTNSDGSSEIYVSKRELKNSDLTSAIKSLIKGPDSAERKAGVYSEIPGGTKLLSVVTSDNKIIINMNDAFQYGGGTQSINDRLKQLVKTVVSIHPDKNLYLYIEGKQIDVMGGDGVMITQPLNLSDFSF